MTVCKSCGASIIWIKTSAGKTMPRNAEPLTYRATPNGTAVIVTPNGETLKADIEEHPENATGIGYISHFATCPNAAAHRRRRT